MLFKPGTVYFNETLNNINLILKTEIVDLDYSQVWIMNPTGRIIKLSVENNFLKGDNQDSCTWKII
jgi:hypothetical protein